MKRQTPEFNLAYFAGQAIHTRRFGHTYVHKGAPDVYYFGEIVFTVTGFGRSLQGGGHKYKVSARRNDKAVPNEELQSLLG
jgi:hypothetical protein